MRSFSVLKYLLASFFLLSGLGMMGQSYVQDVRTDTLCLHIYFPQGVSGIDPDYRDNGARMQAFREAVASRLREGCALGVVLLSGSSSPEGSPSDNQALAGLRAHALGAWLADTLGLRSELYYCEVGEDWEGLARIIRTLDASWRDAALEIIEDVAVVDARKNSLRSLEEGKAWRWLDANVFPELRTAGVSVECIVAPSQPVRRDTVYVTKTLRDTVYFEAAPPASQDLKPYGPDFSDRRMLFALRTNMLTIPFANLGVEVSLGRRWSVGADIYYPWLWRSGHAAGVDETGVCNELAAADVELRYWFPRKDIQDGQRLLGHSVGLYGAAGYYDFERDWSGLQGEFFDVGLDYLYAAPLFRGRMHLEAEIGLGFIRSTGRPYECLEPGGVIYHHEGVTKKTTWVGPTRAQLSLVVPIYTRKKGGMR